MHTLLGLWCDSGPLPGHYFSSLHLQRLFPSRRGAASFSGAPQCVWEEEGHFPTGVARVAQALRKDGRKTFLYKPVTSPEEPDKLLSSGFALLVPVGMGAGSGVGLSATRG